MRLSDSAGDAEPWHLDNMPGSKTSAGFSLDKRASLYSASARKGDIIASHGNRHYSVKVLYNPSLETMLQVLTVHRWIACPFLGGFLLTAAQSHPKAGTQETAAGWHPIMTGNGKTAPPAKNRLTLETLDGALSEIRVEGPRYRAKLTELSGPDLEKEIAANLGVDPASVSEIIAKGLASSSPAEQSIAYFAQASYAMAETKALEAAKQAGDNAPATTAVAWIRAGDACIFKGDSPAAIAHYRAALALAIPDASVRLKVTLLSRLGRALHSGAAKEPEKPPSQVLLQQSLEAVQTVATLVPRETMPQWWAVNLLEKARVLSTLAQGKPDTERRRLLAEAKAAAGLSLEAMDRKVSPTAWVRVQQTLGGVCIEQAQGLNPQERMPFLNEAVEAHRNGLEALEGGLNPARSAAMQHNLAIALQRRCFAQTTADGMMSLRDAFKAYQDSMEFYTREDYPVSWAEGQTNCGLVCRMMAATAKMEMKIKMLGHAEALYRLALEVLSREENPKEWANAQEGLGNTFEEQGDVKTGEEQLRLWEEAEKRYLAAVEKPQPAPPADAAPSSEQRRLERIREKLNPLR